MNIERKNWGGRRVGAGRPLGSTTGGWKKQEERKDKRIVIVCTEEQNRKIKYYASEKGVSVSSYIIEKIFD